MKKFAIAIYILFFANSVFAGPVTDGLIAYWDFNNSVEDSYSYHDGTLTGTETYVNSPYGQSMYFDGATYITVSDDDALDFETTFSISFWINAPSHSSLMGEYVLSKWTPVNGKRSYSLFIGRESSANDRDCVGVMLSTNGTNSYFPDSSKDFMIPDQWQNITLVFDGTTLKFYQDGIFKEEVSAPYTFFASDTDLVIGAYNATDLRGLVGCLDELSLYNTALDAGQVAELYNYVTYEKYPATTAIPEPMTLFLLGAGASAIWFSRRR